MIARLLASTAAAAVILAGISAASLAQTSSSPSPSMGSSDQSTQSMDQGTKAQPRKAAKSSSGMKDHSTMSRSGSSTMNKQTAQGHKLDNIADKLNVCGGRPPAERQSCMDEATRM
jgi:hypothetical protein